MGEIPTTYSEAWELMLSVREGLQSMQATLKRHSAEIRDIRDRFVKTRELLTGTATGLSEFKEQVDLRVPEVRNSFGKSPMRWTRSMLISGICAVPVKGARSYLP